MAGEEDGEPRRATTTETRKAEGYNKPAILEDKKQSSNNKLNTHNTEGNTGDL